MDPPGGYILGGVTLKHKHILGEVSHQLGVPENEMAPIKSAALRLSSEHHKMLEVGFMNLL